MRAPRRRVAVSAFGAIALLACGGDPPEKDATAPPVMVVRATAEDVVDRIEATGQLLAQVDATVAAQIEGQVTQLHADEGSLVVRGQDVIELDPERRRLALDDAGAGLAQARARLEEARREATRLESLAKAGAVSQARVDTERTDREMARSEHLAAEARVGLARRALEDATVDAPFDGWVARRHVSVGEFVSPGQPLFQLVALDPIEVEFFLSEVDSSRASVGQSVEVRVAPFPNEVFDAQVSFVAPTIEPETRTRRVKALLPNPDGRLLPGTFARVDLGVAKRSGVVMVPKEAVLLRSDGSVLFRLAPGGDRVERVRIELGRHRGDRVEVRGGLGVEDYVVVRGHAGLVDGSPVSLRNADGTPIDVATDVERGESGG